MNFNLPNWSVRNPLGTIALFISLVYGICAGLLGVTVGTLKPWNETALVAFVALFPCGILWVFAWLVSKHHKKLYGPGDYRSDEGFLEASQEGKPENLGERLKKELSSPDGVVSDNNPSPSPVETHEVPRRSRDQLVLNAYTAENLVFQELQSQLNGAVERNKVVTVADRTYEIDGIIRTPERTHLVEVIHAGAPNNFPVRVARAKERLRKLERLFPNYHFILAIVGGTGASDETYAKDYAAAHQDSKDSTTIQYFSFKGLLEKYGLPTPSSTQTSSTVGSSG